MGTLDGGFLISPLRLILVFLIVIFVGSIRPLSSVAVQSRLHTHVYLSLNLNEMLNM